MKIMEAMLSCNENFIRMDNEFSIRLNKLTTYVAYKYLIIKRQTIEDVSQVYLDKELVTILLGLRKLEKLYEDI